MSSILPCSDLRDAVLLSEAQGLYLKPLASVWISVQLPAELKRTTGKSVSTWEIMEKIKSAACPDEIVGIKVYCHFDLKICLLKSVHQGNV